MKRLTEREIQERLYGKYHKASEETVSVPPAEAPPTVSSEPKPPAAPQDIPAKPRRLPRKEKRPSKPVKPAAGPSDLFSSPKPAQKEPSASRPLPAPQAVLLAIAVFAIGLILFILFHSQKAEGPRQTRTILKPVQPVFPAAQTEAKRFTIQAIVYNTKEQAGRFADDLKGKNLETFIQEELSSRGEPRYLVFVGSYATAGEAAQFLETLTRRYPALFKGSFVRRR